MSDNKEGGKDFVIGVILMVFTGNMILFNLWIFCEYKKFLQALLNIASHGERDEK